MTFDAPASGLEQELAAELVAMPIPYLSVLGALLQGPFGRSDLQRIMDEDVDEVLQWHRQRGLVKSGIDLVAKDSTFALTNLGARVLAHVFNRRAPQETTARGKQSPLQAEILKVLHRAPAGMQYPALRFAVGADHREFRDAVDALIAAVLVHRHLIPQETGVIASVLRLSPRGKLAAGKLLGKQFG